MNKCPKCGRRLAKRHCPGLKLDICHLCCGQKREKEINCFPECRYLVFGRTYQEKRIQAKETLINQEKADPINNEHLGRLVFYFEAALLSYRDKHPGFNDKNAYQAIEYALEKIRKGAPKIIMPDQQSRPVNEAGDLLIRVAEETKTESSSLITTINQKYSKEEKISCLTYLSTSVKAALRQQPNGTLFLDRIREIFSKFAASSKEPRIILPG